MQVTIPFQEDFKDRMLEGKKNATTRTKRYGEVGDTFSAFDATFEIIQVWRIPLGLVANALSKAEGFQSPEDFIQCWKRLHPRKGYMQEQKVYTHIFKLVR